MIVRPFFLFALCAGLGCAKEVAPLPREASQVIRDLSMTQTTAGHRSWALRSPSATLSLDGSSRLDRPVMEFYRDGKHASTAEARFADVPSGTQNVSLSGGVVIRSQSEKSVLRTEDMDYSAAEAKFRTDGAVVVEREGAVLRGRGLVADSALSEIRIRHQETRIQ